MSEPTGDLRLLPRLWPHARPDAWAFGLALVLTPAVAALNLAQPLLLKSAIDDHIAPGISAGFGTLAAKFCGVVVGSYILEAVYTLAIAWGGMRVMVRLRAALYRHALGLAQRTFDRRPAGQLLTRVTNDVEALGEALGAGVVTILLDGLTILGTLGAMVYLNVHLTLVLLALAPLLLGVIEMLRRGMRGLFLEIREAQAALNAYLAERIDGVEVVQLFGQANPAARKFDVHNRRFRDANTTSNVYEAAMFSVVDGFSSVAVAVMLWYSVGMLSRVGLPVDDTVTAGLLVAFIDYIDRLFRPLRDASGKIAILQRAAAALTKIFGLLDEQDQIVSGQVQPQQVTGHLRLSGVRFRYRADSEEILKGVDLELRPGEVVALVGPSGSGKTTLTRLIDRSYAGYEGSIQLDGVELSDLHLPTLRRHVAAVRQDIQLFSETLRFNLGLGDPRLDDATLAQAAALVHADRPIEKLGWDHVLRERGAGVSQGEGQLLTFARTMAHDPVVVILDEATASVDSVTEALIQDAIARIFERKTVLVIAHRLSTVQRADRIAVMDAGRIVEVGTHDELLARGGRYAALVAAGAETLMG